MYMSVLAYISLGVALCITILTYFVSPDTGLLFTMLPMLLLLGGIPILMNVMNRRYINKLDLRHVRKKKIKEVAKKGIGEQVRISGVVTAISNRWLNRPNYHVLDSSGEINVCMFVAPRVSIRCGDQIEVVGTLRWVLGFKKKEKRIWGLQLVKIPSPS
ncbi:hypothetical protein SPACI_056870 [Sporomusa acidovorans DSM 3132]|uniref:Nucleotide-binding protein n=1 Tax=Sporomusa acidovorans (strain ATCC 49682 / DSM 3132 / Mol) TaxID=1123286 RepID=A0ABZ3JBQ7_SPOA4|nr:hypothetical protein SPACI_12580 [Sporomusa acidovorans DSM 3132]SDE79614.1 hypothetical protein SAMN04488499_102188 [Sporomusa acidovorans]